MKIGIEAQRIYRIAKHGMEVVALELTRQIQQLDGENEYLLFAAKGPDRACLDETPNFHNRIVRGFSYADWEQVGLPRAIRKEKLSLIHCTANTAPFVCPAPLLLTLHDVIFLERLSFAGSAYQNFGNIYRRAVVPKAIKKALHIITVSNAEKEKIIDVCKVSPDRISVIYNGVSERFHSGYDTQTLEVLRHQLGLPERFILFHGNTAPKKNTVNVINAFIRYCHEFKSPLPLVVTDYSKEAVQKILKVSGNESLLSQFIFTGYVPSTRMPLLYNSASLFLYPSLRESFGLPILEAMACGVPVITSGRSAMAEIAGGAASLVDPEQPEDIAAAISDLHTNAGLRTELIAKGYEHAAKFQWRNSAVQLLELYKRFS